MNSLNPIKYIVFFALVMLISCEDNYELVDEEIIISEPSQVDKTVLTGKIYNSDNDGVANAEILVSYNDSLIMFIADPNGNYSIELPKDGSRAIVQAKADDYMASGMHPIYLNTSSKASNIKLLHQEEVDYNDNIQELTSDSLATISGTILYSDGTPAIDAGIILIDFSSLIFISYSFTDGEGNYALASEPFENYGIFAYSECDGVEIIAESLTLSSEDIDLGTYSSNFSAIEKFTLSGTVTNCFTGEGIITGTVAVTFDGNSDYYPAEISPNGEYSIIAENCSGATCYNVTVSSPQLIEGNLVLTCEAITSEAMIGDYTLCGEEVIYDFDGIIEVVIEGDTLNYPLAQAELDENTNTWTLFGSSEDFKSGCFLITKATGIGIFDIEVFQVIENEEGLVQQFAGSGSPFKVEITEANERLIGSFYGDTFDVNGEIIPLTGTFDIKI